MYHGLKLTFALTVITWAYLGLEKILPPLALLGIIFLPVLPAILVRRFHMGWGVGYVLLVLTFMLFTAKQPSHAFAYWLTVFPLGLTIGLLAKNKASFRVGLGITLLISLFTLVGMAVVYYLSGSGLPLTDLSLQVTERVSINKTQLEKALTIARVLIPGNFIVWSLGEGILAYIITNQIIRRLGYTAAEVLPLKYWQLPWYTIWILITGLLLALIGDYLRVSTLTLIAYNVLYIAFFIFLVNGCATVSYFLGFWRTSKFVNFLLLIATLLYWPVAIILLTLLGVIDTMFNWRRVLDIKEKSKGKGGEKD